MSKAQVTPSESKTQESVQVTPSESKTQKTPQVTPQSLVTEDLLRGALKADKGDDAEMVSWEVKDFTKKGDNYASVVTSGVVRYRQGDQEEREVTYVAKCNPCRPVGAYEVFNVMTFSKEANFYSKLLPLINTELEGAGQNPMRMATCYNVHLENKEQIILLKDLRKEEFKMFDRKKGMDLPHLTLVLRELARMHAASAIAQDKMSDPIEEIHDWIQYDFHKLTHDADENLIKSPFEANFETGAKMAEKIGGYDKVVDWLRGNKENCVELFKECLKKRKPFDMICHGDCWNNNILYKYDDTGKPVDVRLIDLQMCRKASPATDLNYLLYTSLNGSVRRENLEAAFNIYYDSFSQVYSGAGRSMPFTLEELKKEYHDKNMFGLLMALMVLPAVVAEGTEFNMDEMTGDMDKDMENFQNALLEQLDNNKLLRPRLLAVYDEMIEYGVI